MPLKSIKTTDSCPSSTIKSLHSSFKELYKDRKAPVILNAYFVTGFADAEGSFVIIIRKNPKSKIGWKVETRFQISLHQKDLALLELIRKFFNGVGTIHKQGKDYVEYRVTSIQDLINVIIPHFDKFPLITLLNFLNWL